MSTKDFLAKQLEETAQIIEWALNLFPKERLTEIPPQETHPNAPEWFGKWSALRLLFHLVYYEETIALPSLKHWIGEPKPSYPEISLEEKEWEKGMDLTGLLLRFQTVRKEQVRVIDEIDEAQWSEEKLRYYGHGMVSAAWFVAKTIQHTFSHGDRLLRKALYWDDALEHAASKE
ncbi:MAG: DinB family protein [Candidatus Heimdallarchaeota archaeon]|nr:MAG: DinB family protein [Candidatus Heimdallarchaeota archaeon]